MKKIAVLFLLLISLAGYAADAEKDADGFDAFAEERPEKLHDDVAPGDFRQISISGNARSIVIRPGSSENFAFYNGDLDLTHTYTVRCDGREETLDIAVTMENPDSGNHVLGSVLIEIPQKEFERVEVAGEFKQISLYAIDSEILVHANDSVVNLHLEAERLKHNIVLKGSESNAFRCVSVYFDRFPDNISMDLDLIQGGTINDPQDILKENGLKAGAGKPVISINDTKEINIYRVG